MDEYGHMAENIRLLKEQLVEIVGQGSWGERPGAIKTGPVIII